MEYFKKIIGYENYSISNLGNIRNDKTRRILKPYKKQNGYLQIQLGRKQVPKYIHRLMAITFLEKEKDKIQVDHINGKKDDNRLENIRWVSVSENCYAYGYEERIKNKQKKIIAINKNGEVKQFDSRKETAEYFKCSKSQIDYGRYYKKGNKKDWKFEIMI